MSFEPFTGLRGAQDEHDAGMTYEERKAAWEEEQREKSVGGKADAGAGRARRVASESMNDLIREGRYAR